MGHERVGTTIDWTADHRSSTCSPDSSTDYSTGGYRVAAVTLWGEAGAYAHDAYKRWRPLYPELPDELPIVIGITAYGACVGLTRTGWEHGPRITIFSSLFHHGGNRVADTMAHEMLHAWLAVTGRNTTHDSEAWYAAVRRLSPAVLGLELDVRRGQDRKSVRVPNPTYEPGNGKPKTVVRKQRVSHVHEKVAGWPERIPTCRLRLG